MTTNSSGGAARKVPLPLEIKDVQNLADLGGRVLTLVFEIAPGQAALRVALRVPTYHRWVEIGELVPEPPVRHTGTDGSKKVVNLYDTTYVKERARAADHRGYLRLADALDGGGLKFTADTLEGKADELRRVIAADIAVALIRFLNMQIEGSAARLDERAEPFQ